MKLKIYAVAVTAVLILVLACGGSHQNGGSTTPGIKVARWTISPTPVYSGAVGSGPRAATQPGGFSLIPEAHAQSTPGPIQVTGNYSGFCHDTPRYEDYPAGFGPIKFVVYGMGRWDDSNCRNNWSNWSEDGAPIIGDGTLGSLYVLGTGGSTTASGLVEVYVNGTLTPITCTLGTSNKCTDTIHTYPVKDGDSLFVRIAIEQGDHFRNLRVLLGKQ